VLTAIKTAYSNFEHNINVKVGIRLWTLTQRSRNQTGSGCRVLWCIWGSEVSDGTINVDRAPEWTNRRRIFLLRPSFDPGRQARALLCRRDDGLSEGSSDSHFRLHKAGTATVRGTAGESWTVGGHQRPTRLRKKCAKKVWWYIVLWYI